MSSAYISGGIGDVFAVESFLSEAQRQSLTTLYYGTRQYEAIKELFKLVQLSFPKLKNHVVVWDRFDAFWAFYTREDCRRILAFSEFANGMMHKKGRPYRLIPKGFDEAEDWSIAVTFPQIFQKQWNYTGSSFLKHQLANIDKFGLPTTYAIICPCSTDKRLARRDFSGQDWVNVIGWLRASKRVGVVVNNGNDRIPTEPCLINLSNKTTMPEAVEILKKASWYVGIDSCLSILAAKWFNPANMLVKSVNQQFFVCQSIYLAPKPILVRQHICADDLAVAGDLLLPVRSRYWLQR